MSLLSGLRILVFIFLSKDISGVIITAPLNAVAEVGQRAIFNCTSDLTIQFWILTAKREDLGTAAAQNIAINCVVQSGFATHYDVDRPGGNTNCNLIVKNTTMQQAGIYTCSDIDRGPSAILTVIDTLLNATYNTTEGVVVEKDNVIIECVLNHNGTLSPAPTLRPYYYWTDSNGQNVSSSYDSTTDTTAVSQLTVTAVRQDITPFTCNVDFQLIPTTNTGYASNTPTVSNSATSPIIAVLYCPGNITINSTVSKADKCVYKQENLTCTADANPPAQYEWLDLNSNSKTSGPVTSIASGGQYQCTASNTIRSQTCNITETVTEDDCTYYPVVERNMTISGTSCTNGFCYCSGSQSIELTCHVYSMPGPTYRWYWNDDFQTVYSGNQTIRLIYDGTYSCIASNSFGTTFSMATVSTSVFNCTVPPSTTQSIVSESTATVSTTGSTTAGTSGDSCDVAIAAAIAVGVILFISLASNIMQLIIMVKNMRTKHDPFKRAGTSRTILSPETLDLSNEPPAPATYEELTRSNEIHLQPTYDKLTPKPPAPATYQELTHPDEIHLQPPTYEKLTTKPPSYVDDLS